jgi:hypothetical protein
MLFVRVNDENIFIRSIGKGYMSFCGNITVKEAIEEFKEQFNIKNCLVIRF